MYKIDHNVSRLFSMSRLFNQYNAEFIVFLLLYNPLNVLIIYSHSASSLLEDLMKVSQNSDNLVEEDW